MNPIIRNSLAVGLCAVLFIAGFSGKASAATLFADNFQGNLSQWDPIGSAVIVDDPLVSGGFALTFDVPTGGGDLFSKNTFTAANGLFTLSYDYLGINFGGGFVAIRNPDEHWLSGVDFPGLIAINPDTNQWEHVSFSFYSATPVQLELEAWSGRNGTPREAFFKNLVLTGNPVPEPSTLALFSIGWAGLVANRRRKRFQ